MSPVRKIGYGLIGTGVLLVLIVYWLLATTAGVRWLLAQLDESLPAQLVMGEVSGNFIGGLDIERLSWVSPDLTVHANRLHIATRFLPIFRAQLDIEKFSAASLTIESETSERVDIETPTEWPSVELPLTVRLRNAQIRNISIATDKDRRTIERLIIGARMSGSDLTLDTLELDSDWLQLNASGAVELDRQYPAKIALNWELTGETASAGELLIQGNRDRYTLEHQLREPLRVDSDGTLGLSAGELSMDLAHRWDDVTQQIDELIIRSEPGELRTAGNLKSIALTLMPTRVTLDDFPTTEIALQGSTDLASLIIEQATLTSTAGDLVIDGDVSWQDVLEFEIGIVADKIDPASFSAALNGSVAGRANVSGETIGELLEANISLSEISGTLNDWPVEGSAQASVAGNSLQIDDASLSVGDNDIQVRGSIAERIALDAQLALRDLSQLFASASGQISGTLNINGTREEPELRAKLDASGLAQGDASVASASLSGRFGTDQAGELQLVANDLKTAGQTLSTAVLSITGSQALHDISLSALSSSAKLTVAMRGGYAEQQWRGKARQLSIAAQEFGQWELTAPGTVEVGADHGLIDELCLQQTKGTGIACVSAAIGREGDGTALLKVRGVPLAGLPLPEYAALQREGLLEANFSATAVAGHIGAEGSFALSDASLSTRNTETPERVNFDLFEGGLTLVDNALAINLDINVDDGGQAAVNFGIPDIDSADPLITGDASLAFTRIDLLALLAPGITEPSGKVTGSLKFGGHLSEPQLRGELRLSDGNFGVRQAGILIENAELSVRQPSSGQLEINGSARSGQGSVLIKGSARLAGGDGPVASISFSGENFELARLPDWQILASPDLVLSMTPKLTRVTGRIGIPRADIRLNELPAGAEAASPDAIVHRTDQAQRIAKRRFEIDVTTALGEQVAFSGFGLTTKLGGEITITAGTQQATHGNGQLALIDGRYEAYGQDLVIERGELRFDGPLDNPRLNIRAVRTVNEVTAGIRVTGTPSRLTSDLYSEPTLSDAETLSYLIAGRPLSGASASDGALLNNAAFALGLSRAGSIVSELQSSLGLDTLTIEGGAQDGKIVAGKRIGSRLLVEYGYGLIDKLGTLLLRYELNDRLYLESRTGEVSNLDLIYRVKKD